MKTKSKALLIALTPLLFAIQPGWAHIHPAPAATSMSIAPAATAATAATASSAVTGESTAPHACDHHRKPDFKTKMDKVMGHMHKGMMDLTLTGNEEIDFLKMMIPHHQSAIDMSIVILETSKDKEVIELAKAIIAEQKREIALMDRLIKQRSHTH